VKLLIIIKAKRVKEIYHPFHHLFLNKPSGVVSRFQHITAISIELYSGKRK